MSWNIFKKDNSQDEQAENNLENNSLDKKIDAALTKAQNDKRATYKEIEKIKGWAAEAIVDTYVEAFPNGNLSYYREQYKVDALEKFEQIKADNATKVTPEQAAKCTEIVTAYLNQIALRQSKLTLFEKLETEYQATKEKLNKVNSQDKRNVDFASHAERLNSLDEHGEILGDVMVDTMQLDDLNKEFELKAEYINQLEKMTEELDQSSQNTDNSLAMKEEVDKMIADLKK